MAGAARRDAEVTVQWVVASSFPVGDGWITGSIQSSSHRFTSVDPTYRHDRSRSGASVSDWRDYLSQALRAWRRAGAFRSRSGIVTVFPQLALLTGIIKRLTRSRRPVVATMFNLGRTPAGLPGRVARFGFSAIDRFVVHSTHEIDVYSTWLRLPRERFVFVPLSIDEKPVAIAEDEDTPFVLSMGTAHRDYRLLMGALEDAGVPAIVVAGSHALQGLDVPRNVEVRSGLTIDECHALCQRARLSIVPLAETDTAAGQVSVLEAMMYGRAVIATDAVGTVDYVEDEVDGVLVAAGDRDALSGAIARLWKDTARRDAIASAARRSALSKYTFGAVARRLETVLDDASRVDGAAR